MSSYEVREKIKVLRRSLGHLGMEHEGKRDVEKKKQETELNMLNVFSFYKVPT